MADVAPEAPGQRRPWLDAVLLMVLCLATLWRLAPAVDETSFHRDEARWIHNSTILREWRHPLSLIWQDEGYVDQYGTIDEQNRRRSQPPLAMYVLGIGIWLQRGALPGNGYWIMSQSNEWNAAEGNMPTRADLRAGRWTDVVIALLTVCGLYVIGMLATNRVGGAVTGLLFGLHPLVENTASRAWSDPLLALCVVLTALAGYWFAKRPGWGRALLFGAGFGLGASAKLSPLIVSAGIGALGVPVLLGWLLTKRRDPVLGRLGAGLLLTPVAAFVTFVALYPYLWTDPIDHTRAMFDFRTESFRLQGISFPAAKVEDRADAFRRVGDELGRRFSTGGWIGRELDGVIGSGNWSALRNLDLGLALIGWLIVVGLLVRNGYRWPQTLMLTVIAAQAAAVIFGMGVEYARYLLPVLLAVAVGAGVTFGMAWEKMRDCLRQGESEVEPYLAPSPVVPSSV